MWALLIGVQQYQHVNSLQYVGNDVARVRETLIDCLGFDRRNVKVVLNGEQAAGLADTLPTCETIRAVADEFLRRPLTGDTLIVYFSGQGVQDASGKLYLAAADFEPEDLRRAGVSAEWLKRQLAESRAQTKLLIIDSCFAGTEKSAEALTASRLFAKTLPRVAMWPYFAVRVTLKGALSFRIDSSRSAATALTRGCGDTRISTLTEG